MAAVAESEIQAFLTQVGQRYAGSARLYLLGGSALCLLGSQRTTIDIDYVTDVSLLDLAKLIETVGEEMQLDIDAVPIDEFIPVPADAPTRHQEVGRYDGITVYIYDPYTIALSKLSRGFEADIEDVVFLLEQRMIDLAQLEAFVEVAIPKAGAFDIDPAEMRGYLAEVGRRYSPGS